MGCLLHVEAITKQSKLFSSYACQNSRNRSCDQQHRNRFPWRRSCTQGQICSNNRDGKEEEVVGAEGRRGQQTLVEGKNLCQNSRCTHQKCYYCGPHVLGNLPIRNCPVERKARIQQGEDCENGTTHGRRDKKSNEGLVVPSTYAVSNPETVVVEFEDAVVAVPAVRAARWAADLAGGAEPEMPKACIAHQATPELLCGSKIVHPLETVGKLLEALHRRLQCCRGMAIAVAPRRLAEIAIHLHQAPHLCMSRRRCSHRRQHLPTWQDARIAQEGLKECDAGRHKGSDGN
mmetsp:Transcript_19864/g.40366  ORF Transcript_19864/g.40366 Transcript_19864/m.40366 type:complete len:289 (-) Transcript_19864:233-1099(-)